MCDAAMPPSFETVTIHPISSPGWFGGDPSGLAAVLITALVASLLMGLVAMWTMNLNRRAAAGGPAARTRAASAVATVLCIMVASVGLALSEEAPCLEVFGPRDNAISSGPIKEISESYSSQYNIPVNITSVNGRKSIIKMLSDNSSLNGLNVDVVMLEEKYPLYNLTGMKALMKKGLIENYSYLYTERALLISGAEDNFTSLDDLEGERVAVTDQHVPGGCLARDVINATGINVTKVAVQSTEAQLDAVADGTADATVLWESMFDSCANSSSDKIVVADLPEYKMDNYIAVLKSSPEKELAEEYVDYLLKSLSEGGRAR